MKATKSLAMEKTSRRLNRTNNRGRDLIVQMTNIKNGLVREFGTAIGGHNALLRSALNEAEALAYQTAYPHLLFPLLAEEKASQINHWAARQRRVQRASREFALAV